LIDRHDIVVRLKDAIRDPLYYGTKVTHIVGREQYRDADCEYWEYPDSVPRETFRSLNFKPSVGLFAICCVRHHLSAESVSLIGFDSLLGGVNSTGGHKWAREKEILESLGMEVTELGALH
jgi:hypothetical protein